jgi:hypothetical protein
MAEAAVKQQHAARRLFLESHSRSDDIDDHLLTFIEDLVVEAEMRRTRTCMSLDQRTHKLPFLLTRKFKLSRYRSDLPPPASTWRCGPPSRFKDQALGPSFALHLLRQLDLSQPEVIEALHHHLELAQLPGLAEIASGIGATSREETLLPTVIWKYAAFR